MRVSLLPEEGIAFACAPEGMSGAPTMFVDFGRSEWGRLVETGAAPCEERAIVGDPGLPPRMTSQRGLRVMLGSASEQVAEAACK